MHSDLGDYAVVGDLSDIYVWSNTIKAVQCIDEMNDVQVMTSGQGDMTWWVIECFPSLALE